MKQGPHNGFYLTAICELEFITAGIWSCSLELISLWSNRLLPEISHQKYQSKHTCCLEIMNKKPAGWGELCPQNHLQEMEAPTQAQW